MLHCVWLCIVVLHCMWQCMIVLRCVRCFVSMRPSSVFKLGSDLTLLLACMLARRGGRVLLLC